MSVAYKPSVTNYQRKDALKSTYTVPASYPDRRVKQKRLSQETKTRNDNVPILPSARKPLWLLRLSLLQRSSSVLIFCLLTVALGLYSGTVYAQRAWNQAYRQLESLQRQERQLTTASEVLKNKIAQQAEQPETGLSPADPTQAIFLKPAPQRPARPAETIASATSMAHKNSQSDTIPLGY
ncbi:hypothetical protein [Gloeocapsopsis dulcis]|uniref:Cell division protein FtsL n=1 Tax=Gloeocapsopsis dulcis AAB1 = 1H9 TaxID=1433147 RepID=A0A6N8FP95_9CHRO|nr:hypothetical protein [Gloeocapsopsis dulcis]MUL35103.1 hypothetical protein [Gloeocapsopsis dulcis AAB1 = 1H9]WNN88986.1 hypothetical protein P0S91_22465 [Gloeocapsopsis dulcis]